MSTCVYLVRHGETAWNTSGRWQGHAPVPLNDQGRRQAKLLGESLAGNDARFGAIYSSDLLRSRETAEIIAGRLGLPVRLDARLREIDLGEWQGLTGDEIRAWDADRLAVVHNDPYTVPRPGGESLNQVALRALAVFEEITVRHPGETVVVVSHGGTIRTLLNRLKLFDGPISNIGNTSVTILGHGENGVGWRLESFNLMDHLGEAPSAPWPSES